VQPLVRPLADYAIKTQADGRSPSPRLYGQYWRALQLGPPPLLPPDEMARVLEKFRDYGRQD
jgi:hypothetical protein